MVTYFLGIVHVFCPVQFSRSELCPLDCKEIKQSILKEICPEWCWSWSFNTLAIWCEELTHWKRLWRWKRLKAEGEGDDRGWDGWMASLTQWIWVWVGSGSWWWTGKPGVLQSMGSQRVGHKWVTELNTLVMKIKLNQKLGFKNSWAIWGKKQSQLLDSNFNSKWEIDYLRT